MGPDLVREDSVEVEKAVEKLKKIAQEMLQEEFIVGKGKKPSIRDKFKNRKRNKKRTRR